MKITCMKRFLLLILLIASLNSLQAQNISSVKINDLKSMYTKGDSVYVINFWATFCKPCIEELPYMQSISKKYAADKVSLVMVSLDIPAWYPTRLQTFVKKNNMKGNIAWLNESNADQFCPVIDKNWSGAIPATLIYNAKTGYKKFVEEQYTPASFEAELKKAIKGTN